MLGKEIKNIDSSPKKLREFGLLVGGIFLVLGVLLLWKGRPAYPCFLYPGVFLMAAGLLRPIFLKWIHKIWMGLALVIGWVVSHVLLAVLFYGVITPLGWAIRMMRKDILSLRIEKEKSSYWIPRQPEQNNPRHCERQF